MVFDFFDNISASSLLNTEWIGIVEDNNDPTFSGRCRVRVFSLMDGREDDTKDNSPFKMTTQDLPWCYPSNGIVFAGGDSKGAGNISIPKNGAIVKVKFNGGNLYAPEYISIQDLNDDLITEISDSYEDAHVILYDKSQDLKLLYKKNLGFQIYQKGSSITINPDSSITIDHKDSQSIVELIGGTINVVANSTINITSNTKIKAESSESILNGNISTKLGPSPVYSAVLAEPLWIFLKMIATTLDAKFPTTPSLMSSQADAFQVLSTSKNVKLSP